MRRIILLIVVAVSLLLAAAANAKDVYLSIAGSVGNFRTDARIWNPSSTRDIVVSAYFLPVNQDNSAVAPVQITIPKRQMKVYDDVVASLFSGSGLGGIRLTSPDDFVATSRIYAQDPRGTLGQFVEGMDESSAKTKGVIIQLKASNSFRTNIGYVNPNSSSATITLRLYDRSNTLVGQPLLKTAPPFSASNPFNLATLACNVRDAAGTCTQPSTADLTDAWVSFSSDKPVFAYGSVIDNGTTDPTFVPFAADSDSDSSGAGKVFNVVASSFKFDVTPALEIAAGERVTFRITNSSDVTHGFTVVGPDGQTVVGPLDVLPRQAAIERTFVAKGGTYAFGCTHVSCGVGHSSMIGTFVVAGDTTDPNPKY